MSGQQTIKYTIEHYRKDGVSDEKLLSWFNGTHIPLALPLMDKYGITKYSVHTRRDDLCDAFQANLHRVRPTWEISKADFVVEYWMPSLECFKKLVSDPEWLEGAAKDQDNYLDMSRSTVHIGEEVTYLENGKVLK
ncbi:hypothetical protein F4821DRAFT_239661 [Hypoxylon rubiginosum]|uniref:Uncharacterized protein n=1 Tax=Hypoxylon rubiginosum TaxID=110542 RepID=A0ACC0CZS5_9PEZI|nr:hypothetical protein F4821DRAFT_239661 [Hypoxylon rubiginosum]